jgi:hypothetical protein
VGRTLSPSVPADGLRVRPTGDEPSSDKVIFFLGPLLGAGRASESLPRKPPGDGRPPLLGALRLLESRNPPELLPPDEGLVLGRVEVRLTGLDVDSDSVSFFLGPLFEALVVLLFLGDGDDFVKGN